MNTEPRLVFFGSPICPYCQRVELTLLDAALPHRICAVDFTQPNAAERDQTPFGRFPVLRVGEDTLFESGPILEWINERGDGSYLPSSIGDRARVRGLCAAIDVLHATLRSFFTAPTLAALQRAHRQCVRDLSVLDELGGPWSAGAATFADSQPYLSAFYLTPLALLCELLDTPEFPLLDAVPRLKSTTAELLSQRQSLRQLGPRRPAIANFFLGIQSALSPYVSGRLRELAGAPLNANVMTPEYQRYFDSKLS